MTSNDILSMVFGDEGKGKHHFEHKTDTVIETKSYVENVTSLKVVNPSNEKDLFEALSERNDFERRAMYNVTNDNNNFHNHRHHNSNRSQHDEITNKRSHRDSYHNDKKNHLEHQHQEHSISHYGNHSSKDYHKSRTESLLSSVSSSLLQSIKNDYDNIHHHKSIDQFSESTLTDGERTPFVEDFKSVISERTLLPRQFVQRDLKSPASTRPSTVIGGYKNGHSHKIRDIVNNERVKELAEQLREEIHFRNKFEKAYSDISIEEELAHLPDEPEDDSESVASDFIDNITSGRNSAHFLVYSSKHVVDPMNVKLQTPLSTRPSSVLSIIHQKPRKYEIKEYSLKKPIEPTPNPNPLTPYTIKPKTYSGNVHGRINKKKILAPKSPNPTPRESISIFNNDIQYHDKNIDHSLDKKSTHVNRMDSIRVSKKGGCKDDKNYDFNIKNNKTLICCDCGCHHVFTSGIPHLRFSVIKRVIGTESRKGSIIHPFSDLKKMPINDKNYFNITTN
uniref:SH2 domain-containing protein n=1 Tax=Strongyloides venezuelensis TaxID=75913 RepID=A0A0K0FIP0_STRVS